MSTKRKTKRADWKCSGCGKPWHGLTEYVPAPPSPQEVKATQILMDLQSVCLKHEVTLWSVLLIDPSRT